MTIINDASSGINKLKVSLIDIARGVFYNRHMFMLQATANMATICNEEKSFVTLTPVRPVLSEGEKLLSGDERKDEKN